jgi:dephospho-CoA kinase
MARSRLEIASDLLEQVAQMRKLTNKAEQAFQLPDDEKLKLAEAIIDTGDMIENLVGEMEGADEADA